MGKVTSRGGKKSLVWCGVGILVVMGVMVVAGIWLRESRRRVWMGEERFTVIITNEGRFMVESFDPVSLEAIRVKIPSEMEIETVGGKGVWRAGSLASLAEKNGWRWAADSVADFLGITYTVVDREMGVFDKFEWWRAKGRLKLKWKEVTLEGAGLAEEILAADGARVLGVSGGWREKSKEWFGSVTLASSGVGVRVVNTVGIKGLGSRAARSIESSGLRVTMIENDALNMVDRCVIQGSKDLEKSLTVRYLRRVFGCDWEEKVDGGSVEVVLKLGEDYKRWWLGE